MIEIKRATVQDASIIAWLGKKTFDESFGYLYRDPNDLKEYLDQSFGLEKLKSSLAKPNNYYWLAYKGKEALGYAKIQIGTATEFIQNTNVCKLQRIYILQEYLSEGIGTRLQKVILEKALEFNCEYIWLSALKSNEKATQFYKRKNYKIVGEHPFTIGKEYFEFWVMAKKI